MTVDALAFHGPLATENFLGRAGFLKLVTPRRARPLRHVLACAASSHIVVALTREAGKNEPLREALSGMPSVHCLELPCVRSVPGPDRAALGDALRSRDWSWVMVTSPEAAAVLCDAWNAVGCPELRAAAVGDATASALQAHGITVDFVPRKATGKSLVDELEGASRAGEHVLYPASLLASADIELGLAERGYDVTRLNTYTTEAAQWNRDQSSVARDVHVVTFAAPSAVKAWVRNAGTRMNLRAACIGETSRQAAVSGGFTESRVFHPPKPGLKGWVNAIRDAIKDIAVEDELRSR
jgi:uroporphyrinogen-III synthase